MTLLRTTITGPLMVGVVVAVSLESAALLLEALAIPGEVFLLSLAVGVCAVVAHLAACVCAYIDERLDRVEGRIDSYEVNSLYAIVGPHASPPPPTPLRRVR